jgi:hypothetical protein
MAYYTSTAGYPRGNSSTVWAIWTNTSTTATTSVVDPWPLWHSTATSTTSATATTGDCWSYWAGGSAEYLRRVQPPAPHEPTPEQRAAWVLAAEQVRENARKDEAKRKAANDRAQALLDKHLADDQRQQLREHGHFFVCTKSGGRYRIRRGRAGNIDLINRDGVIVERLCAHPGDLIPDQDTMLAQKLMLECSEAEFLKVANRSPVTLGGAVLAPLH